MSVFWILLVIAMICMASSDSSTKRTGEQIACGLGVGVLIALLLLAVLVGFTLAPTATAWVLGTIALAVVGWIFYKIYQKFFSAEARLQRAYKTMHDKWYAMSWHVAQMELGKVTDMAWGRQRGEAILARAKEEHERYKLLPPETGGLAYRAELYVENIPQLEARFLAVLEKAGR